MNLCVVCRRKFPSYRALYRHRSTSSCRFQTGHAQLQAGPELPGSGVAPVTEQAINASPAGADEGLAADFLEQMTALSESSTSSINECVAKGDDSSSHVSHDDGPQVDPHIPVGDTTSLPPSILMHLHKATDLENDLRASVGQPGQIGYADKMFEKLQPHQKSGIHLLNLMKGQPLSLYDQVQKWRHNCTVEYDDPISHRSMPASRSKMVEELMTTYGYDNLRPRVLRVSLPCTKVDIDLIKFPFCDMMKSLLTDPELMQPENLNIDVKDPFAKPTVGAGDGVFDDFSTGSVHVNAHERYCVGPTDILNEILLFIDKSHLDLNGKHTLEPIMFTMCLFHRKLRNLAKAWRPMGYLPNLDKLCPHASADDKLQDYHYCLRIILSELSLLQKKGGIDWDLCLDGATTTRCRFQIPVNCILGDTAGHDTLCTKVKNRSSTSCGSCCRSCYCEYKDLGDPFASEKMHFTKAAPLRRLRNNPSQNNLEKLRNLGYKPVHDGFVDVHFSDPERALHGATPAEILHAFQTGLAERAIETCFSTKKLLSKKAKAARKRVLEKKAKETEVTATEANKRRKVDERVFQQNDNTNVLEEDDESLADSEEGDFVETYVDVCDGDEVVEAMEAADLANTNVFSDAAMANVDRVARELHYHLRWQSEKNLPRTGFHHGITKLAKMSGNERTGVLLVLLLVLVMDHWGHWRRPPKSAPTSKDSGYLQEALGYGRASNMIKALSLLIQYESFMRWTRIPKNALKAVKLFIPSFLDQVFRAFNRTEGAGNNLVKSHFPNHLCDDVQRLGSPQNFNSGPGETLHKTSVKEPGKRTNKSHEKFEEQAGVRYVENLTIERSYLDHPHWTLTFPSAEEECHRVTYHGRIATIHTTFIVDRTFRKRQGTPLWPDSNVAAQEVVSLVRDRLLPSLPERSGVRVMSKTKRGDTAFSAHPAYGRDQLAKQDWCLVSSERKEYPTHLLCFLHLPNDLSKTISVGGMEVKEKGHYALVHQVQCPLSGSGDPVGNGDGYGTRAHADQHMVHHMPLVLEDGKPKLMMVPCDSISDTLVGIPDATAKEPRHEYFFLSNTKEWASLFVEAAKRIKKN